METEQRPPKRPRKHSSGSERDRATKTPRNETDGQERAKSEEYSEDEGSHQDETGSPKHPSSNPNDTLESTTRERQSSDPQPSDLPVSTASDPPPVVYSNGDWQAVFDPSSNAYYFANNKTGETTWKNPMVGDEPGSTAGPSAYPPQQQLPDLGGIDPELARLDPQISRLFHGHSSASDPRFSARFNARTGRFEADPAHDPARVSQFARARTQAEAFFDVSGWEKTLEKNNGRITGTSKETRAKAIEKGKKLSKAQLEEFKKQKMEKKARNQRAWLK